MEASEIERLPSREARRCISGIAKRLQPGQSCCFSGDLFRDAYRRRFFNRKSPQKRFLESVADAQGNWKCRYVLKDGYDYYEVSR